MLQDDLDMWGLSDPDADVSITHFGPRTRRGIASILVPVAGGSNSDAALDVASDLARTWNASLHLLTVVSSSDNSAWMAADTRLNNYADVIEAVPVETHVRTRKDVVATITEFAQSHDLVVIGGSERSLFRRLFKGTIPKQLAKQSETPIFVVERNS
jgi:nucleotide-binding universal stress UspA family protein